MTGITTRAKTVNFTTDPKPLCRGVRQGDPLSPLLFNMVLDPLLHDMNDARSGGSISSTVKVSVMAFADDLVLLEDEPKDMFVALNKVTAYLSSKGMSINPRKCAALTKEKIQSKLVTRQTPIYQVEGAKIQQMSEVITCLGIYGHDLNASGLLRPSLSNLPVWLSRLERASLKPHQKLHLLKAFIVPKMFYILQTSTARQKAYTSPQHPHAGHPPTCNTEGRGLRIA